MQSSQNVSCLPLSCSANDLQPHGELVPLSCHLLAAGALSLHLMLLGSPLIYAKGSPTTPCAGRVGGKSNTACLTLALLSAAYIT